MDKKKTKAAKFRALQQAYTEQLPTRLMDINESWGNLQKTTADEEQRREFYRHIHSMAGSSGTFGYIGLSKQARKLEEILLALPADQPLSNGIIQDISMLLKQLSEQASKGPEQQQQSQSIQGTSNDNKNTHLIYVVEDDALLADEIVKQLGYFDYEAKAFLDTVQVKHAMSQQLPAALVLDVQLETGPLGGPNLGQQLLTIYDQTIPCIYISVRDDWQARLAAVHAGGSAYLKKPLDMLVLVECLDELTGRKEEKSFRVLIVEDTELLAQHYAMVLQAVDMEVEVLNDPSRLLDMLPTFKPELILMDIYMPGCMGTEAAQVIRQNPAYVNIPIVYLSTEGGLGEQLQAMRLGGDDFLQKPIADDHLIAAVSIRAQRFRVLSSLMVRDSLTGLLNHITLKLTLENEVARTLRSGHPMSFVMLDIDHFKAVNDNYGHPVGDAVIKSLARFLSQRLRKSDIVGRYGGEEFAIILPDTKTDIAYQVINDIRAQFAAIAHVHDDVEFNVTISAGIACVISHTSVDSLLRTADEALYQAKHEGRNRVVVWQPADHTD